MSNVVYRLIFYTCNTRLIENFRIAFNILTQRQTGCIIKSHYLTEGGINMLEKLTLERPIAFVDVETTGINPHIDRIVELSIFKIKPDGVEEYKSHRVNPGEPIPAEATSIHGITDDDIAGEPAFHQYAKSLQVFLEDCDIAGFNVINFDLPFLEAEFRRAGVEFSRKDRQFVDSMVIFHEKERRDLKAAYLKYCGKELENAHTAEDDARASAEVLAGQLEMYEDLPRNVAGLSSFCVGDREHYVDEEGRFLWSDSEVILSFGKHSGRQLREIAQKYPDYLDWVLKQDFSLEVKEIVDRALKGQFPEPNGTT